MDDSDFVMSDDDGSVFSVRCVGVVPFQSLDWSCDTTHNALSQPSPVKKPTKQVRRRVTKKKPSKVASTTKKKKKTVLGELDANIDSPLVTAKKSSKKRSQEDIERLYTKKTQLEHILLRPDTYGMTYESTECTEGCP